MSNVVPKWLIAKSTRVHWENSIFTKSRRGRAIWTCSLAVGLAICLAGCGKSYTYNYRLTVTVRDNDQLRTGSSVVRVTELPTSRGGHLVPRLCGEATIVELGHGKLLAALLEGRSGNFDPDHPAATWQGSPTVVLLTRLGLPRDWPVDDAGLVKLPDVLQPITLNETEYPDLVAFENPGDPSTLERVDVHNLAATLGSDVQIVSVVLQPTKDGVTDGAVKNHLPWFNSSNEYIGGVRQSAGPSYHSYQFSRCARFSNYML